MCLRGNRGLCAAHRDVAVVGLGWDVAVLAGWAGKEQAGAVFREEKLEVQVASEMCC